ncbi:MAG: AAA family ATPase [Caldilineaceae bacterium]
MLSDVSSGYNVSGSLYLRPTFNELCGFTEAEIAGALRQVVQERGLPEEKVAEALELMRAFYNGYSFSYETPPTLYNPTLALYFLDYLKQEGSYPRQLFDSNLEMDRVKIDYIAQLPHGEQLVLAALQEAPPVTVMQLADRFGVERMLRASAHDTTFMASLLYYFGVLTLTQGRSKDGEAILRIPNQVARKLYAERYLEALLPQVAEVEEGRDAVRVI